MAESREKSIKELEKRLKKQPGSPLFALLADYYLEEGRADDALRVCKEGITHHPYYATGHLLKARTLVTLGKAEEARKAVHTVNELLPGIETIQKLLADLGGPVEAKAPPTPTPKVEEPFVPPSQAEELQQLESVVTEAPLATDISDLTPEANFTPVAEPAAEPETQTAAPAGEETQEEFTARIRQELAGTENTLSLDDYLSGNSVPLPQAMPSPAHSNEIEDLAGKLQGAKITPVIDLSHKSEDSDGESAGFVTPTLAEIYVKQGWFDDAIKAYKSLAASKPELREAYEAKIKEVERMKQEQQ
ncbi:MAG: tetratricopeptide repeat protein [Ignavibacteriae bacterium]|nr:tetratricopeptide repeat protein [Ignavibacteriota bacterium]